MLVVLAVAVAVAAAAWAGGAQAQGCTITVDGTTYNLTPLAGEYSVNRPASLHGSPN